MDNTSAPPAWHSLPNAPAAGTVVAHVQELADGQATLRLLPASAHDAQAKPFGVLLLRSDNKVTAFVNRCAHFGVPLAGRQEQLIFKPHISISCNVHYARYRWSDGVCEFGDCEGESLIPVPLQVSEAGQITIALAAQ